MREILFRGKRLANGKWVYGGFNSRFQRSFIIGMSQSMRIDGTEVIPETVGQYTGLDKNGTKIFEGDIVKVEYIGNARGITSQIAEVVFEKCKFALAYGWHKEIVCLTDFANVSFEVIGNIHDNPELLKECEG